MKKRRMTAAFLAAALGVTALTGCGGTGGSTDTGKSTEAEKISTTNYRMGLRRRSGRREWQMASDDV